MIALLALTVLLAHSDETPEKLRARIAGERDLMQKSKLEVRLADMILDQARKLYGEAETEKGDAGIAEMMTLCEQAYKDMFATHRDPRNRPGGFKDNEIRMRDMIRRLKDLSTSLPSDERPPVDKAIVRLRDMHDDLLDGIMRIHKKEP